jgi:AraC family transcriptional regulator of adaptative response/methylated-DNA-[protein]-cysteine methyltransferase
MMITATKLDEQAAWQQLLDRDASGTFLYGVATTGVFCRPNCKSRLPLRQHTRFFASAQEARSAGFRACLRCKPEAPARLSAVVQMCAYLERHIDRPVRLAALGKLAGISPFTAQRQFKQAMGATPSQYQRAMRASKLRGELRDGAANVTEAIYEAGYGSSSRAYESTPLGMTPGRFLAGGRGEVIRFAIRSAKTDSSTSQLGAIIVAATHRGICWLALGDSESQLEAGLRAEFPAAEIRPDAALGETVTAVMQAIAGKSDPAQAALPLDLRGTAFQLRVWQALRQIPQGETRTYSGLAAEMGMPKATRAVARACALNRVSVLVPCHRVVGASGALTGYRWGVDRKRHLLEAESGHSERK